MWQLACSLDHVAGPGDFFEHRVGMLSVLVVRGDDGKLRAFQNVCRHRGNPICQGSGGGLTELRCGFHRWCWDLRGELRFTLAAEPAGWGEAPPSPTPEGEFPQALMDLLEPGGDDPLLDDDSRTERCWEASSCVIDLPPLPGPGEAIFLTLTSGAQEGGDPIAWRLEGSDDGRTWHLLDQRSDERFRWRRQTRPFMIASPRPCTHHRIVVETAQGPVRLAQVELLV